jgi:hypothetical protein
MLDIARCVLHAMRTSTSGASNAAARADELCEKSVGTTVGFDSCAATAA